MTIFRFSLLLFGLLLPAISAATVVSPSRSNRPDECGSIDPFATRKCVGGRIERKQILMARQFISARRAVASGFAQYGQNDVRTAPKYLDASQADWKRFVDNNCTVIAAYGGGSNSAISDREMDCYEEELDRRIQFLRDVAKGTGIVGP